MPLISIETMDAFPCSYIVLTFQAANTVLCFRERRIDRVGIRCCWLCLRDVMRSQGELLPTRQLVYVWCFICVSVTVVLLLGGVVSPTLNPQ